MYAAIPIHHTKCFFCSLVAVLVLLLRGGLMQWINVSNGLFDSPQELLCQKRQCDLIGNILMVPSCRGRYSLNTLLIDSLQRCGVLFGHSGGTCRT